MAIQLSTLNSTQSIYETNATRAEGAAMPSSMPPAGPGPATSVAMSKPGELFSKLQNLASSDPAKFKEVMSDLAQKMKDAAAQSGDTRLGALANRFAQAAQSGDVSALAPQAPAQGAHKGGHHGHHHAHGAGQGSSQAIDALFQNAIDEVNQALGASTAAST